MIRPLLAALLLTTTSAGAQITPTGIPAADILLAQAITEQRVFLTCSSLDPRLHARVVAGWQIDAAAAATILARNNAPPEAIAAFTAAARPENLLPAQDTPHADVRQFCNSHPDWQDRFGALGPTRLSLRLPQVLE